MLRLVLTGAVFPACLLAQSPNATIIRTSGSSARTVVPDRVLISVTATTSGRTPSLAGTTNATLANRIRAAVSALGVPSDSITTQGYSVSMRTWPEAKDTSYVATNTVLIRLRRLSMTGRVIDTALTAGASNLSGVTYTADEAQHTAQLALGDAVRDARAKAETMAAAAGGRLGRLVLLTTERLSGGYGFEEAAVNALVPRDAVTTIAPPPQGIGVWVLGQWEFLPTSD